MDVMIDIETLSTNPSDALILSIAAVELSCAGREDGPAFSKEILIVPDLKEQILLGRHIDRKTQLWWRDQPFEAQDHWMNPAAPVSLQAALIRLGDFLKESAPNCVWANGAVFDFGILEHAYHSLGLPAPWKYNAVRDARTAYDMLPGCRQVSTASTDAAVAHHPLSDCRQQIIRLWEHGYNR